jgi:hypothetical protein
MNPALQRAYCPGQEPSIRPRSFPAVPLRVVVDRSPQEEQALRSVAVAAPLPVVA